MTRIIIVRKIAIRFIRSTEIENESNGLRRCSICAWTFVFSQRTKRKCRSLLVSFDFPSEPVVTVRTSDLRISVRPNRGVTARLQKLQRFSLGSCFLLHRTRNSFGFTVRRPFAILFSIVLNSVAFLFRSSKRDSSNDMTDEPMRTGQNLTLKAIFDLIPTCSTEISSEASSPFHQIEKFIILADYQSLFNNLPKFIVNQDINGSLLRFATHISLFLFQHNNSNQFAEKTYVDIVSTYIQHLIELEFKDLVCYYISKLPDEHRCETS